VEGPNGPEWVDGTAIQVTLPCGRTVPVPFSSHFKSEPVELVAGGSRLMLDTVLLFPLDRAIRHYLGRDARHRIVQHKGEELAKIGYIYLFLTAGHSFTEFAFTAATTDMSLLFTGSRAVQHRFLDLLGAADGLAGLVDKETEAYHLLDDPSKVIEVNPVSFERPDDNYKSFDVDGFTRAVLERIEGVRA
jgi:energy-converting hydrogenase Eha subunit E